MLVLSREWTNFKSGGEKLSDLAERELRPCPRTEKIFGCVLSTITKSRGHPLVTCLPHALNSKLTTTQCPTLPTNCEEHMGF